MTIHVKSFTSNGSFTVPAGITSLRIFGVGGGGSGGGGAYGVGGGGTSLAGSGGSGGGAAIARTETISVTPNSTLSIAVSPVSIGGLGSAVSTTDGFDGYDGYNSSITYTFSGSKTITFRGAEGGKGGGANSTNFFRGGFAVKLSSISSVPSVAASTIFTGTTGFLYLPLPGSGGWGLPQDLASSNFTSYQTGGHWGAAAPGNPGFTTGATTGGSGAGGGATNFSYYYGSIPTAGSGGDGGTSNAVPGGTGGTGTFGCGGGGGGGGFGNATSGGSGGGNGGNGAGGLIVIAWET